MIVLWCNIRKMTFSNKQVSYIELLSNMKTRKYFYEKDSVRHLTGLLLAEYSWNYVTGMGSIGIVQEKGNKPYYVNLYKKHNIQFSISHAGDIVICAVSSNLVGIDIEKVKTFPQEIINHYYTKDEIDYCKQGQEFPYKIWTRKECYLKAIGVGIGGLKRTMPMVENGKIKKQFCGFIFKELQLDSEYETVVCTTEEKETVKVREISSECLIKYLEVSL